MKIAVIPIDNRPICYDLIQDVLALDSNIELFMPKIEHLGGLTTKANIDEIFNFLESLDNVDYLIGGEVEFIIKDLLNSHSDELGIKIIIKTFYEFSEPYICKR